MHAGGLTMARYTADEISTARETLLRYLKPGSTVFTITRTVSRSGMRRVISPVVFVAGEDATSPGVVTPTHSVAAITGMGMHDKGGNFGVVVNGCGMDMGFHLVYTLSQALFGRGDALKQRWL
jgi:hypothetical protein